MTLTTLTPTQGAIVALLLRVIQLLALLGIETDPNDLTLNYDGRSRRLDIGRLDADGHLAAIVASLDADLSQPATFGRPVGVPMPDAGETTH